MNKRVFLSVYEREEDILGMAAEARRRGLKIVDIHAPYPVHGLETVAGFSPSRLPWMCFLFAVIGAAVKIWFEFWTTAVDWPINVAGKPWNSLPAFIPVTFEVMVLFAGVGTFIAFVFATRLYPGRPARMPAPRVTDNRFALTIEQTDATFDPEAIGRLCRRWGAVHVEEGGLEG